MSEEGLRLVVLLVFQVELFLVELFDGFDDLFGGFEGVDEIGVVVHVQVADFVLLDPFACDVACIDLG